MDGKYFTNVALYKEIFFSNREHIINLLIKTVGILYYGFIIKY